MHDEGLAAGVRHFGNEPLHEFIVFDGVDADPVLHGHRQRRFVLDGLHALGNQTRFRHQAGAERAFLYPLARAADVEVDLVVAVALPQLCAMGEVGRLASAELERDRMLLFAEGEVPLDVAMNQRAGGDHFGVKVSPGRDLAQEIAAVPVGPVHHRRYAQPVISSVKLWWYSHLWPVYLASPSADA